MRAEDIVEAMSFIDESYIIEARTEYTPHPQKSAVNVRELVASFKISKLAVLAASAACVCLIVLLILPKLTGPTEPTEPASPELPPLQSDSDEPEPSEQADPTSPGFSADTDADGKLYIGAYSTDKTQEIKITETTDKSISFEYKKSVPCETYVYLYFKDKSDASGRISVVTTASGYTPAQGETLKQGTVKIYVNGKYYYDRLPQEAGEYEIKIDFSALCDESTELWEIKLTDFVKIPIGRIKEEHSDDIIYGQADESRLY